MIEGKQVISKWRIVGQEKAKELHSQKLQHDISSKQERGDVEKGVTFQLLVYFFILHFYYQPP